MISAAYQALIFVSFSCAASLELGSWERSCCPSSMPIHVMWGWPTEFVNWSVATRVKSAASAETRNSTCMRLIRGMARQVAEEGEHRGAHAEAAEEVAAGEPGRHGRDSSGIGAATGTAGGNAATPMISTISRRTSNPSRSKPSIVGGSSAPIQSRTAWSVTITNS